MSLKFASVSSGGGGSVDDYMYWGCLGPYSKLLSIGNHPKYMRKDDLRGEIL